MRTATGPILIDERYELLRPLGEGGQAAVFAVYDHRIGVQRAMKILLPHLAAKPKLRARFESEARTMAQVDHPNVVRVYDVAVSGKVVYFVMEHVQGGTLSSHLRHRGPLPPRLAVRTMLEVSAGVAAVHRQGIIHRDLKPQNVLVTLDGVPKIADFGIARRDEGMKTRQNASMGTVGFTAPEQMSDARTADVRSDVYSLGVTLFVASTAVDPGVWHRNHAHPRLVEPLRLVIDKATQDAPDDRYPSVDAWSAALLAAGPALPPDPVDATLCADTEEDGDDELFEGTTTLEEVMTWFDAVTTNQEPSVLATPPSVARTYTMSRPSQAPASERPSWVVEEAPPVLPTTLDAVPEEPEPSLELPPPPRKTSTAVRLEREHVPRKKTAIDSAAAELFVLISKLPWGVIAPATVLGLIVAGLASWRIWQVTHEEALRRREAEVALTAAMEAQEEVVDGLAAIGANGETLEGLRHSWITERDEADRERIRRLYLTELHREADRVLQPQDVELRQAIDRLDEAVALWERAHPEVVGASSPPH